jgi:uncharacterized membrane protein
LEEQFWGPFGGICTRRRNAPDLCAARSSGRLRYRLDPHHPALGSGNTEGRIVRRCLHDDHEQWQPKYLPKLRKRLRPLLNATVHRPAKPAAPLPEDRLDAEAPAAVLPKFAIGQAIAKTITFRIIVTTLDFTTNYLVIGELGTAAGLSTFNLVAGPLFYLGHEAAWNYLGPAEAAVDLPVTVGGGFTISRALAKTVTFRTIATAMDFTTNYVVVGDVAAAVVLSASGFILGPFVYFGHERAWDYFSAPRERTVDPPASIKLLPAPA